MERATPYGRQPLGAAVSKLTLVAADGRQLAVGLSPAPEIQADGDARIVLAKETLAADTPVRLRITLDLPEAVRFYTIQFALRHQKTQAAGNFPVHNPVRVQESVDRAAQAVSRSGARL